MTRDQLRKVVCDALASVAPEIDFEGLDPTRDIREQCDLDSVDFYNVVLAIHTTTGIAVPEVDYPKLATLNGCLDYLYSKRIEKRE